MTTGATAPRPTSRGSGRADPETGHPHRTTPPSRACSAAMLLSKDAIADVSRGAPGRGLLPSGPRDHLRRDHRPLRPGRAGRPDHRRERAAATRRARPHRRRAVPPHAVGQRADRGERRLLRRDRPREGHPAAAGRGRHPHRADGLRRPGRSSTTSSTRHRPRSTRSPTGARRRTTSPLGDIMDGVLDEIEAIGNRDGGAVRRAHRLRRPRRPHQRSAPRPDDDRRGPSRHGQGACPGHPPAHARRLDDDGRGCGR